MFKKILFATSATPASDHAARVAFNIAKSYDAHLDIFHILGVPSRGYSQVVVDVKTHEKVDVDDDYMAWVKEEVKRVSSVFIGASTIITPVMARREFLMNLVGVFQTISSVKRITFES